jgi:PhzF family phenazine biosynthesis protein
MRIYQVDAFTKKPFSGNPAGVCITECPLSEPQMQNIAAELNASETAFLVKQNYWYSLRWFTPDAEVDLCGHATLACAHILYEKAYLQSNEKAVFHTKSGVLSAEKKGEFITLDFPIEPAIQIETPHIIEKSFGVKPIYCGKNRMDIIVELENEETVKKLKPNLALLLDLNDVRGIIVTSKSKDYDFISRFFAPSIGVGEDPVTGSAHCCLIPYWSERTHKTIFKTYQASKRGGELFCELDGERVKISGNAVTVMTCEMEV